MRVHQFPTTISLVARSAQRLTPGPLLSWNEGPARRAIVEFVARVTEQESPDFVTPSERIAVFDNDGTLWAEQPLYFQLLFAIDRVKALAPAHPEWRGREPFASLLKGDTRRALDSGDRAAVEIVAATHAGMSTEAFNRIVKDWLATAKHPATGLPYTRMVYRPMLELLAYLRANGFKTFIVSGSGVEFLRAFAEESYNIPPEQVVGSSGVVTFDSASDTPVLMKQSAVEFIDDGAGKPVGINRFIGRRPIVAVGNSDGDLPMLQWTAAGGGPRLCIYVHHTDKVREWAYDRASKVGHLDKGLDEAIARSWTVVDIRRDWKVVFPIR